MTAHGPQLAEGKTKVVYAHATDPALALLVHKDGITAGDGARRNVIPGKGAWSGRTAANVFALLNRSGVHTHFIQAPAPDVHLVQRCEMVPLEVVMRRLPAGSYLKRHPEASGQRFDPPLVEFFLKDDARHDPQIDEAAITAQGYASPADVAQMIRDGRTVFTIIEAAWAAHDVTLVDMKIEFGRTADGLIVADMIDNDSWRIWPGGEQAQMLDKQVYRNMAPVADGDAALDAIAARYAEVAALTDRW